MRPNKTIEGKRFYLLDDLDRFEENKGRRYEINEVDIAAFKIGNHVVAVAGECPHAGASLAQGWIADDCVTCPRHGWQFGVEDGKGRLEGTCDIPLYETHIENGTAWVHVPAA